jgi:hypothetical protein
MGHRWNEIDREKPKYSGKNLSQYHLSTTNPTWIDPESNPGLRDERPATNPLNHGTAYPTHFNLLIKKTSAIRILSKIFPNIRKIERDIVTNKHTLFM